MKPAQQDWPDLLRLLAPLLELPASERGSALEQLQGDDRRHIQALRALLHDQSAIEEVGFLEASPPLLAPIPPETPSVVGPWRLLGELGRGGMSIVHLAERADGAHGRRVALKLPYHYVSGATGATRFARERNILTALNHPGIAMMIDAGVSGGQPWLALELVEGRPITEHCQAAGVTLRERLRLFQHVLGAVQHAHAQLVIHRDIKPSNVLVTAEGHVKLLDFGVAKLLEDEGVTQDSTMTRMGGRAMTPQYASPEQVAGGTLGTASDVYSLGVLLYELLTGRLPYRLKRGSVAELEEAILGSNTQWPSQVVPPGPDARRLRGDLDAIVMKSLAPRAENRYASVEAFAADIERWLHSQPIEARAASALERTAKLVWRHAWAFGSATAVAITLMLGMAATLWQAQEARREAQRANAVQNFVLDIFRRNSSRQGDPQRARLATARELLDLGTESLERELGNAPDAHIEVLRVLGSIYSELALFDRSAALAQEALALTQRQHGAESLQVVGALADVARELHHHGGKLAEREALLERGLAIVQRLPDRPTPERRSLYNQLVQLKISTDTRSASHFAELSVADARRLHSRQDLYSSLVTAANAHINAVDFAGAEKLLLEAEGVAGEDEEIFPSDRIVARVRLADTQVRLLKVGEAEVSMRSALADSLRLNGPTHLDTLQTTLYLGVLLELTGWPHKALPVLEQARRLADAPDAVDEFTAPTVLNHIGLAQTKLGRHADAIASLRRAIEIRDRQRPDTMFAAALRVSLARTLINAGQFDEARRALEAARVIYDKLGVQESNNTLDHLFYVRAGLRYASGDAEGAYREFDRRTAGSDRDRPVTISTMNAALLRAEIDLARHRDDDALQRLRELRDWLATNKTRTASGATIPLSTALPLIEARRLLLCGRWALRHDPPHAQALLSRSLLLRQTQLEPESAEVIDSQRWVEQAKTIPAALPGAAVCE